MIDFKNGVKYVRNQIEDYIPQHIPIAERWRENRIGFIAIINLPYYFDILKFREDIVGLTCWIFITGLSIFMLYYKDKYDEYHLRSSTLLIGFYDKAERDALKIGEKDYENKQKEWCEKVFDEELLEKETRRSWFETDRLKRKKRIDMIRNIAICFFVIAVFNEYFKNANSMKTYSPKWLIELVAECEPIKPQYCRSRTLTIKN